MQARAVKAADSKCFVYDVVWRCQFQLTSVHVGVLHGRREASLAIRRGVSGILIERLGIVACTMEIMTTILSL